MGRFCSMDYENGRGVRSRSLLVYYGDASPSFESFPFFEPYEARSTGENGVDFDLELDSGKFFSLNDILSQDLLFKLDSFFIESNIDKEITGYVVKVVFSEGNAAKEGAWTLSYHNSNDWETIQTITFDPDANTDDDLYTTTVYLDGVDFSDGGVLTEIT